VVILRRDSFLTPLKDEIRGMRNPVDQWQDLRLVDFEVCFGLAVAVQVCLRFPPLNQNEESRVIL
jgi:hypothetical protein